MTKDNKNREKIENKQPGESQGILRVEQHLWPSSVPLASVQEQHNISHVLWYLGMVVHSVTHGFKLKDGERKTDRIIAHLSCLSEFIREETDKMYGAVQRTLELLKSERPQTTEQWTMFLYKNWDQLRLLAAHSENQDVCFPESSFQRISDLATGIYCVKLWWWKLKIEQFEKQVKKNKTGR